MIQKLFTLGPVEMHEYTRERPAGQLPYFRTEGFSGIILECAERLKRLSGAPEDSHVYLLTCSGTGAMEAVVGGCFCAGDRLLAIDGGGFGHRFCELAAHHGIPHEAVSLRFGETLLPGMLDAAAGFADGFTDGAASRPAAAADSAASRPAAAADIAASRPADSSDSAASRPAAAADSVASGPAAASGPSAASGPAAGFTGLLANLHETTTGQLYDKDMLASFCRVHGLYSVCDAVGSFLADPMDFEKDGVDALIISSHKALALPPGLAAVIMSDRLYRKIVDQGIRPFSLYFDFRDAEANAVRGQTPFTPAIGTVLALRERLQRLEEEGGAEAAVARTKALAEDFRARIGGLIGKGLLALPPHPLSNACTPLVFPGGGAGAAYRRLSQEYGVWLNPNGGELADTVLRAGHLGDLTPGDNAMLAGLLEDIL